MRPRLVIHVCCAPDQAWVAKLLRDTHELYCYFSNPNIDTEEEHEKRRREAESVAERFAVPFASPTGGHRYPSTQSGRKPGPEPA